MNETGYSILKLSRFDGAYVYAKEAREFATGSTGAGGYLNAKALASGWNDVEFINTLGVGTTIPTTIGIGSTSLITGGVTTIGGTTPIGDLRAEATGYIGIGTTTPYIFERGVNYSGALMAIYKGTTWETGKIGIGTTAGDITARGYYEGNFTTNDIHEFQTSFNADSTDLSKITTGSGVYTEGADVTLQFNILNRNGEQLSSAAQIAADPFVSGQKISILNTDGTVAFTDYRIGGDSTFTFSSSQNIDVFGSFTRNFGIRNQVVNQDGGVHTSEFYLYANTATFDKVFVSSSGQTVLNETYSNHNPPNTGSITSAADRADAIKYFNNQPINDSGVTGFIEFDLGFNESPNFTSLGDVVLFHGTGEDFTTNRGSLVGNFPLNSVQEGQKIRLTANDGIPEGTGLFFKLAADTEVGFNEELFTVGPFTLEPEVEGPDLNLYNQGDQTLVGDFTIEGGLEGDDADGGNLNVSGNALGTGEAGRLTGPTGIPYLLSGDEAGGSSDTLQDVVDRDNATTTDINYNGSKIIFNGDNNKSINFENDALTLGIGITRIQSNFVGIGSTSNQIVLFPDQSIVIGSDGIIVGGSPATGSSILAGTGNVISGHFNTLVGGAGNKISGSLLGYNFVGGGSGIDITGSQYSSSVGGRNNDILNSNHSTIGGGLSNKIKDAASSFIGGGEVNEIHDGVSAIVGGNAHLISGGNGYSFIGGGEENEIHGTFSSVLGGEGNKNYGNDSVTLGGWFTESSGQFSLVGPGKASKVSGDYAVALGNKVEIPVAHTGATVLADGQDRVHASSGMHTATLDFASGVYVPTIGYFGEGLHVSGVPVLTGENNPAEADTLQTVTARGNSTNTSIFSTGPYISGVTGLFNKELHVGDVGLDSHAFNFEKGDGLYDTNIVLKPFGNPAGFNSAYWMTMSKQAYSGFITNGNSTDFYIGHDLNKTALKLEYDGGGVSTFSTSNTDINFEDGTLFVDESSRRVGVGTTSPSSKFHVEDTSTSPVRAYNGSNYAAIGANSNAAWIQAGGSPAHGLRLSAGANGAMSVYASRGVAIGEYPTTDPGADNFTVQGNVGLGTTTALAKLDVRGTISGSGDFLGTGVDNRITNNGVPYLLSGDSPAETDTLQTVTDRGATSTNAINVSNVVTANQFTVANEGKVFSTSVLGLQLQANSTDKPIIFSTNSGGMTERMRITRTGVGIGVPDPMEMLELGAGGKIGLTDSAGTYDSVIYNDGTTFKVADGSGSYHVDKINLLGLLDLGVGHTIKGINNSIIANKDILAPKDGSFGFRTYGATNQYDAISSQFIDNNNNALSFNVKAGGTTSEAFRIDKDGNIGVDTTAPLAKLDVRGDISGSGNFLGTGVGNRITNNGVPYLLSGDSPAETQTLQDVCDNGNTTTTNINLSGGSLFGDTETPNIKLGNAGGAEFNYGTSKLINGGSLVWQGGGVEKFRVTAAGNVGVGTNSPTKTFDVRGDAFISGSVEGTGAGNRITNNGVPYLLSGDSPAETQTLQDVCDNDNTTTTSIISTGPYISGVTGLFSDKVGIGTASPVSKLTVESNANALADADEPENYHLLLRNPANDNTEGVGMGFLISSATNDVGAAIVCKRINNNAQSELQFWNKQNTIVDGAITQSMTIDKDGNVGIGTTAPAAKLELVGKQMITAGVNAFPQTEDYLYIGGDDLGGANAAIYIGNRGNGSGYGWRMFYEGTGSGNDNKLKFKSENLGSPVDVITMLQDGKVGIGATSPSVGLQLGNSTSGQTKTAIFNSEGGAEVGLTIKSRTNRAKLAVSDNDTTAYVVAEGTIASFGRSDTAASTNISVLANGNVGIGSTSPAGKLQVYTSANRHTNILGSTADLEVVSDNNTNPVALIKGVGTADLLNVFDNTTEVFTILDGGNVGIGSTSPSRLLTLENNSSTVSNNSQLRINNIGAGDAYIYLFAGSDWSLGIDNSDSDKFKLCTSNDVSDGNEVVTVDRSGNVGIGTTNPLGKLHVRSANAGSFTYDTNADDLIVESNANGGLTIATAAANTSRVIFASPNDATGGEISFNQTAKLMKIGPTTANGLLALQSANGVETMRLDASNNVGIGTTAPAAKLEVAGGADAIARITGTTTAARLDLKTNSHHRFLQTIQSDGRFRLYNQTTSVEQLTVLSGGNVGIGTTSPSNALDVVGHFSATSKSFLIDHPTKENKKLQYASLEGPENGVYVRGTTYKETIELPEYWSELVHEDSITVVLTPIGKKQDLFIKEKSNKLIKIGGAEGSFDYVVYGERKDIDKLEIEPLKV